MDNELVITGIEYACAWLDANEVEIPPDIYAAIVSAKFSTGQDFADIQDEYNTKIYGVMDDYTQSEKPITAFRNAFRRTSYEAFFATGQAGWIDGGRTGAIDDALTTWLNDRHEREMEFIAGVFSDLKALRKTGTPDEIANYISERAAGYTGSLEGIYNYAKMQAAGDRMGVWRYGATEDHCVTENGTTGCEELEGQEHPLSWFSERGYVPRQKGSTTITCGCWRCDCEIADPETGERLV
jgi:hypothetical protein